MSIENFYTNHSVTLPPQAKGAVKSQGLPGAQAQGMSFLDFILSRLDNAVENGSPTPANGGQGDEDGLLQSDNKLLEKNPELNIAELLAANPEIEAELKDFMESTQLGPEAALTQVLALNQQAFDDALKPLSDGIITAEEIANGSPRILQALLIDQSEAGEQSALNLKALQEKLESLSQDGNLDLALVNLTPEQITELQNLSENGALPAGLEGNPFAMIIQMVAPANQPDDLNADPSLQNLVAVFLPPAAQNSQNRGATTSPQDTLASRLNALNAGGDGEALFTIESYEGNLQPGQNGLGKGKPGNGAAFEALMQAAANKDGAPPAPSPDLNILQNWPFPAGSALFSTSGLPQGFIDQYGLNTASTAPSTLGTMTSMITQAQSASAAHPATQMVAVNLKNAAKGGQDRTITMQLDPPDLGRVQVKMSFGADKKVKAVLLSEKPETHMMLQRDAQALERALQGLELDADGGLQFELAEQGFDFDQNNQRGGGHDGGGTGANGEAGGDEDIIESTMTWQVDPETGHMRYDILA